MAEVSEALQPVNWEAVKMLALTVGVRESARRLGLNEDRVRQRCTREGWLATPEARALNKRAIDERSGVTCRQLSPTAVFQGELAALGQKTRIGLARGIAKASEVIAEMPGVQVIDNAHEIKSVAQTADLVHGWKDSPAPVKIRLEVLAAPSENQVIDVESEAVIDVTGSTVTDSELDEY